MRSDACIAHVEIVVPVEKNAAQEALAYRSSVVTDVEKPNLKRNEIYVRIHSATQVVL